MVSTFIADCTCIVLYFCNLCILANSETIKKRLLLFYTELTCIKSADASEEY